MPVDDLDNMLEQIRVDQMATGQVHGNPDDRLVRVQPAPQIAADAVQHIEIEPADVVSPLQCRDEVDRRDERSLVNPAAEGFRADDFSGVDVDLGLVIDQEFPLFQGVGKPALYFDFPGLGELELVAVVDDVVGVFALGDQIGLNNAIHDFAGIRDVRIIVDSAHAGDGGYDDPILVVVGDGDAVQAVEDLRQALGIEQRNEIVAAQAAENAARPRRLCKRGDVIA